jgi:hypothetical protein
MLLTRAFQDPPTGFRRVGGHISNALWQTHFADHKQVISTEPYSLWCKEERKRTDVTQKHTPEQWLKENDHMVFFLPKGCHTTVSHSYLGRMVPFTVDSKSYSVYARIEFKS